MAIVCPITNTIKEFPFHVNLDKNQKTTGTIMCEQIKTVYFYDRNIVYSEKLNVEFFNEVIDIIQGFIDCNL